MIPKLFPSEDSLIFFFRHQAEGADAAAQSREIWTDRLDRTKVLRLCGRWFQRQHQLRLAERLQQRLKDIPSAAGEWSLLSTLETHHVISVFHSFSRTHTQYNQYIYNYIYACIIIMMIMIIIIVILLTHSFQLANCSGIVWHHWRLSCASTFKRRKDRQMRWTHLFGASLLAGGLAL